MKTLTCDFVRKFESEKRLRPAEFDFDNEIMPIIKERPRFYEVVDLINRMSLIIPDDTFSDKYTNHYFIHCHSLNDGLVAAVAICNMIYSKYAYEIGDYLVDRSRPFNTGMMPNQMNVKMFPPIFIEQIAECSDDDSSDDEQQDDCNANLFLYHKSNPAEIFRFDNEGIRVCFVIYADEMIKEELENVAHNPFGSEKSFLSPAQAAEQLHYTYINISDDNVEDIMCYIVDQIEKNGFQYKDSVKKHIRSLAKHPSVRNEYQAVAAIKNVLNTHIEMFGGMRILQPMDFREYTYENKKNSCSVGDRAHLVGLEKELEIVNGAVNLLEFDLERERRGLTSNVSGCNMVFAGQPGTAKTTVAREFARVLAERGFIPGKDSFRECAKSDIVGQYVGHTAKKVDSLFQDIASKGGGVIFFDEIYTLSENNCTSFDTEAVNCITQNMENYRSKVFCIFAGYEDKMAKFINANPGLSSRISTTVKFENYNDETLCRIFDSIVKENQFVITGEYQDIVKNFFGRLRKARGENFGNGREARNLFENAKRFTASRILNVRKPSKAMLSSITAEDISAAAEEMLSSVIDSEKNKMKAIGF